MGASRSLGSIVWRGLRLAAAVAIGLVLSIGQPVPAAAAPLLNGTLLVSNGGIIYEYDSSGKKIGQVSGPSQDSAGLCLDAAGNVYLTNPADQAITKFDRFGRMLTSSWGGPYSGNPESCVVDATGAVYVAEADDNVAVRKFDRSGRLLATFAPKTDGDGDGVTWVDLAADQCTLLTTETGVQAFDVCARKQLPDFSSVGDENQVHVRTNGQAILAAVSEVDLLDHAGTIIRTYAVDSPNTIALDPDGTSFWASTDTKIYHFDIASGRRLAAFDTGISVVGLAIVGEPLAAGGGPGGDALSSSVPDAQHADLSAPAIIGNLVVAALVVMFIPFPSQLFDATFEQNQAEIRRWFAWLRPIGHPIRALSRRSSRPDARLPRGLAFAAFLVIGGVLGAALEPHFELNLRGAALFLSAAAAVAVAVYSWGWPIDLYVRRRWGEQGRLKVIIGALPVSIVCVLASRLVHFSPGYLYGLIAGFCFRRELSTTETGLTTALAATVALAVSGLAFLVLIPVDGLAEHAADTAGQILKLIRDFLAGVCVAGLGSLVFGLIPLRFLQGKPLMAWNRFVWAVLYGLSVLGFGLALQNRATHAALVADPIPPAASTLVLFLVFGGASIAFWAYFRFRSRRPRPGEPADAEVRPAPTELRS